MADKIYDILIIGGGPAGLTAGLYAGRARMEVAVIEKMMSGGQVLITESVDNYPGFPGGITGPELMERMEKQAKDVGLEILQDEVTAVRPRPADEGCPHKAFTVSTTSGAEHTALAVIVASGAEWRHLGIPGEDAYRGRGVSYCATCDGPLFKNKDVVVIGGGDTAVGEAAFLTKFADKVTLIHRRDRLRATKILQEELSANTKCELRLESVPVEIRGSKIIESIDVKNVHTGKISTISCSGVFIFIGLDPINGPVKGKVDVDNKGYILTDNDMRTSLEGVFSCGDVRAKALRQIVVATGEGAQAAFSAQHYVERLKGTAYV